LQKTGPAIGHNLPMFADLIMDLSSLPRKDEWVERFKALQKQGQQQPDPLEQAKTKSEVEVNLATATKTRTDAWKQIQGVILDQAGFEQDLAQQEAAANERQLAGMGAAPGAGAPQGAPQGPPPASPGVG